MSRNVFNPGIYRGFDGFRDWVDVVDETWDDFARSPRSSSRWGTPSSRPFGFRVLGRASGVQTGMLIFGSGDSSRARWRGTRVVFETATMPSKPPGIRSRGCRRRTSRSSRLLTRRLEPARIVARRAPAPHEAPSTAPQWKELPCADSSWPQSPPSSSPPSRRSRRPPPRPATRPAESELRNLEFAPPGFEHRRLRECPVPLRGCGANGNPKAVSQYDVACFQLSTH